MNIVFRIIIPILIVLLSLGGAVSIAKSAKKEEKSDVPPPQLTVEVLDIVLGMQQVKITSTGVVQAAKTVNIIPQVAGKVSYMASNMQPGRRFSQGDIIIQIEKNDYELALEQEKSRVRRAEVDLQIEQKRQEAAEQEWKLLGNDGEATELASRKPQLEVAKLNLDAAKASMERSQIMLDRTTIRAPFNGIVQKYQVEQGQVVAPGGPLLTLIATDEYWVRVAIPASQLNNIEIPDVSANEGSLAVVESSMYNSPEKREGKVLRLEAQLDPQSRTAHLLVGISNPLEGFPLMLGAYVDVSISGKVVSNAARIPASALNDGRFVLIADDENRLAKKEVVVGWPENDEVVIIDGLSNGDRVVITNLSLPIYGAPLNIVEPSHSQSGE